MPLKKKRQRIFCPTGVPFVSSDGIYYAYFHLKLLFSIYILIIFQFKGPGENVASSKFNSKTISGELRSALLDGENTDYDMEKGILFYIYSHC